MTAATSTGTSTTRTGRHQDAAAPAERDLLSVGRAAAWALGASLAASLLLLFVASVAGADLDVLRSDGQTVTVTPTSVVFTIMLAVLAGTLALATIGRRSTRGWVAVAVGGLVLGLASLAAPLAAQAGPVTTVVLVAMHVVCSLVWVTVLLALLRRG